MLILGPCIEFDGCRNPKGYGQMFRRGRTWQAHRWAWTQAHGEIPEGMLVLHRCDNPPCVNVDHLFLGTNQDNMDDMVAKGRSNNANRGKTHCKRGHEFTEENTRIQANGARRCRQCEREREKARQRDWKADYQRRKKKKEIPC